MGDYKINSYTYAAGAYVNGVINPAKVSGAEAWLAPNWSYDPATGIWTPNPAFSGAELITNGNFDTDLTGWTDASTAPSSIAWNAGQYMDLTVDDGAFSRARQSISTTSGSWYKISQTMSAGCNLKAGTAEGGSQLFDIASLSKVSFRATSATTYFQFYDSAASRTVDTVSCKMLTTSNLFCIRNYGAQVGYSAALSMTNRLVGGIVTRYSDANNYVIAWYDGTNIRLGKVVAGTATSLINTAQAYTQWNNIQIRWNGADTAQLWYGAAGSEAQVGADQDVSAVPAGTWAGVFGTDSTVGLKTLTTV